MLSFSSERIVLARHKTNTGEIQLQQRTKEDGSPVYEIIANGIFLMASYNQVSERALARHALEMLKPAPDASTRVLIGGLGMGFTLQETLTFAFSSVDVCEISPHVVEWNHSYFTIINGHALADPRVTLIEDDILAWLDSATSATYEAILLDVDNGPSWLTHEGNAQLYTVENLKRWSGILKPGGIFAVWSAQKEPVFFSKMRSVFDLVEEIPIMVPGDRYETVEHFVYLGLKGSGRSEDYS